MYTTGIVKDMNDATNPIWDDKYLCSVHQMAIMSELEIREYGLRVNNIDYIDEEMYDMRVKVALSINDMVELRENKYDLRVVDWGDAIKIYNAVHTYLDFCANIMDKDRGLIRVIRPMDDFKKMDEFADEVYEEVRDEIIERKASLINIFDISRLDNGLKANLPKKTPERITFSGYFEERFNNVKY